MRLCVRILPPVSAYPHLQSAVFSNPWSRSTGSLFRPRFHSTIAHDSGAVFPGVRTNQLLRATLGTLRRLLWTIPMAGMELLEVVRRVGHQMCVG